MKLRKIRLKFLLITGFFTFLSSCILYFNNLQLKNLPSKKDYQTFLEIYKSSAQINLFLARELNGSEDDLLRVDTEVENLKNIISLLQTQYQNDFFLKNPVKNIVNKSEEKIKQIQYIRQNFKVLKNSQLKLRKIFFENRRTNNLNLTIDKRDQLPEIYSDLLFSQFVLQKEIKNKIEENINILSQSMILNKKQSPLLDDFYQEYQKAFQTKINISKAFEILLKTQIDDEIKTIDEILLNNQGQVVFKNDRFQFILMGFIFIYFVFVFRMLNFY